MYCRTIPFLLLFITSLWAETIPVQVIKVIDGDTLLVQDKERQFKVRLLSIDAPELDQEGGIASKKALEKHVLDQEVLLEIDENTPDDKYGRTLAIVRKGNLNINQTMVEEGHAWADRRYSPNPEFIKSEEQARQDKKGLWAGPKPPWEFRAEKRGNQSLKFEAEDYSCDVKKSCNQMRSCAEARYHLNVCGNQSLDGDQDGIPCEKVCG